MNDEQALAVCESILGFLDRFKEAKDALVMTVNAQNQMTSLKKQVQGLEAARESVQAKVDTLRSQFREQSAQIQKELTQAQAEAETT